MKNRNGFGDVGDEAVMLTVITLGLKVAHIKLLFQFWLFVLNLT